MLLNRTKLHQILCGSMDFRPNSKSLGFPRQEYWSGLPFPFPIFHKNKLCLLIKKKTFRFKLEVMRKRCYYNPTAAAAKSLQSCPTLCDPKDGSPPGSPIPGILLARTLEWVAISFSNAWKWKVKVKLLSRVRLLATPWTTAYQALPSMGFSRQEDWSGLSLPSPYNPTTEYKYSKV